MSVLNSWRSWIDVHSKHQLQWRSAVSRWDKVCSTTCTALTRENSAESLSLYYWVISHVCFAFSSLYLTFKCSVISNHHLHIELHTTSWFNVVKVHEAELLTADLVVKVLEKNKKIQEIKKDKAKHTEKTAKTIFVEAFERGTATLTQTADFLTILWTSTSMSCWALFVNKRRQTSNKKRQGSTTTLERDLSRFHQSQTIPEQLKGCEATLLQS